MPRGRPRSNPEPPPIRRHRATTPEAREQQLVAAAYDLAEQQILEGTASAQVITSFLKLGSSRERIEQQRIELENKLTEVKIESYASQARLEELYAGALNAMRSYQGQTPEEDENEVDRYDD
jgi:hypothetical protein